MKDWVEIKTKEQAVIFNNYQLSNLFHPLTCPNQDKEFHEPLFGQNGLLIGTKDGAECFRCGYVQKLVPPLFLDTAAMDHMLEVMGSLGLAKSDD